MSQGSSAENSGNSASDDRNDQLITRANLLLSVMSRKAAAARAEARCAELELLLAQARDGNPQPLTQWLDSHEVEHLAESGESAALTTATIDSWEALLPQANQRLEQRVQQLRQPAAEPQPGSWPPQQGQLLRRAERGSGTPAPHTSGSTLTADQGTQLLQSRAVPSLSLAEKQSRDVSTSAAPSAQKQQKQPTSPARSEPSHSAETRDTEPNDTESNPAEPVGRRRKLLQLSRRRGLSASAAAHVLFLLLLAFVGLKTPTEPASLAFESSSVDAPVEAVEFTQPMETSQPQDASEPTPQPAAIDLAENLADAAAAVTDSLGNLSSLSPPSTPTAGLAAAAAARSNPLNANASFFGAAASGNCFCYVIDGSGSMRGGPWEAAKMELLKSLASLNSKQRFYVIFFNRMLSAIPLPGERDPAPRALYANPENLEHARRWIDSLRIDIGAPPNDALKLAIETEPDAIYLLTDGVTKVDVAKFLREENRISDLIVGEQVRVPIHCIAFYSLEGQQLLQTIAAENQGQFIYVPAPRRP